MDNQIQSSSLPQTILFYDGVCQFCDGAVQFLLRHDRQLKFHFCALQSTVGQQILQKFGYTSPNLDTIVMLHQGRIYTESTAVLTSLKLVGGFWQLWYGCMVLPVFFRDGLYRWFARNRYRWFGKKAECRIPDIQQRARFLG